MRFMKLFLIVLVATHVLACKDKKDAEILDSGDKNTTDSNLSSDIATTTITDENSSNTVQDSQEPSSDTILDSADPINETSNASMSESCDGIRCNTPPNNACNGNLNIAIYNSVGWCDKGVCQYAFRTEPCEQGVCLDGVCTESPCQGVSCDMPPKTECIDAHALRVYNHNGRCQENSGGPECVYFSTEVTCTEGCKNGMCLEDPCAHVTCDTPPARYCDGDELVIWDTLSRCNNGECVYNNERVVCGPMGCSEGHCTADDSCANVVCNAPPAGRCLDANTLRVFGEDGTCNEGACLFTHNDYTCNAGCSYGQCTDDACIGVTCDNAPGNRCKNENTLLAWDGATGVCTEGVCSYGAEAMSCATACSSGICENDPCLGVHCQDPPTNYCRDKTNLVVYNSEGSCTSRGTCFYNVTQIICEYGCDLGVCIEATSTDTSLPLSTEITTDTVIATSHEDDNASESVQSDTDQPTDTGRTTDTGQPTDTSHPTDTSQTTDTSHPTDTSQTTDTGHPTDTETSTDIQTDTDNPGCPALEIITHPGGTIVEDTTWPAAIYELTNHLHITEGTLYVEPCTIIKVVNNGAIVPSTNGALSMIGTPSQPITVTSLNASPEPGSWHTIDFQTDSNDAKNIFEHVIIEYGGSSTTGAIHLYAGASLSMSNSTVRHSGREGIFMDQGAELRNFEGNTLVDNTLGPIILGADSVDQLGPGTYSPNDLEGIRVMAGSFPLQHDSLWRYHNTPYVLLENLGILSSTGSANLTIEAGTVLKMPAGGDISISDNGSLTLNGTPNKPITITSSRSGPAPGDWNTIAFHPNANDAANVFNNVIVEYGGSSTVGSVYIFNSASLAMTNSTVRYSAREGIQMDHGAELRDFEENVLTDNTLGPILLGVNSVSELGPGIYSPNDLEGIRVMAGATPLQHDSFWYSLDAPYVLLENLGLYSTTESANLTVQEGTVIKMVTGGDISALDNGSLTFIGTPEQPITITSSRPVPSPGDWNTIAFHAAGNNSANVFDNVIIEYGGSTTVGAIYLLSGSSLDISNSTVRYSAKVGIELDNGARVKNATQNVLTDNALGPIALGADSVDDLGPGEYTGNDVDGIIVRPDTVQHDAEWLAHDVPYITTGNISVASTTSSAKLTINAGAVVKMAEGSAWAISQNGGLTLDGSEESPVTITSAKPVGAPGDWGYITLYNQSVQSYNVFRNAVIEFGGLDQYGQLIIDSSMGVSFHNMTFRNSGTCDVYGVPGSTLEETGDNVYIPCL